MCIRIIARKNGARLRLYSRPGNELTHRFPRIVDAPCIIDGEAVACDYNGVASFDLVRHHRAQSFPLNLPTNRRLCSTVGRRIVEGWTAHCCAVSRRHYDQFGALEPGLGLARPFWRSKELRARQSLHDLPPWSARGQPTTTRDWLSDTLCGAWPRPLLRGVPHGPVITLSHSRSTLG